MAQCTQWDLEGTFSFSHARYETHKTYPLHLHKGFEIYCLLCGNVDYYIEDSHRHLCTGDLLIIRENAMHRAIVAPDLPYERITLHFTQDFLAGFDNTPCNLLRCFCTPQAGGAFIAAALARESGLAGLLHILTQLDSCSIPEKTILVKLTLVRFLLAAGTLCDHSADERIPQDARISDIMQYLAAHLQEPLQLDVLADQFFINKYYLCHKFKQETGITLTDYLCCKRIHQAHCMLQSGIPATQAALACGFSDYSYFYRLFKRQLGVSPSTVSALFAAPLNGGR
ncbi:MAG: AraC family transcriptional regulator [Ruthenibacterium sp.]